MKGEYLTTPILFACEMTFEWSLTPTVFIPTGVARFEKKDIKSDKLFYLVNLTYRYGRESDETMGLTFKRTLQLVNAPIDLQTGTEN